VRILALALVVLSVLGVPAVGWVGGSLAAGTVQPQAGLVPFRAPGGGTILVDPGLVPGLTVLASLDIGQPLLDAEARGGIRIEFGDTEDFWAWYDYSERLIRLSATLRGADPRVLAALLAHEAQHAQADVDGIAAGEAANLGEEAACIDDEHRATVTELRVWLQLFGPGGRQPERTGYEEEVNEALAEYLASPAAFRHSAPTAHASQCLD